MVKEDVRRVQRLLMYDSGVDRHEMSELQSRMDQAERSLAGLYRAYGQAFFDLVNAEKARRFDQLADALHADLEALQQEAVAQIGAATERCRKAGARWAPPPEPLDAGLPAITPDGRVNQIVFAKRSLSQFQELEKPLGLAPVHSVSMYSPGTDEPGKYDWSAVHRQSDAVREAGIAKRTCLATPMVLHDGCYAAPWLLNKAAEDSEILHVLRPAVRTSRAWREGSPPSPCRAAIFAATVATFRQVDSPGLGVSSRGSMRIICSWSQSRYWALVFMYEA